MLLSRRWLSVVAAGAACTAVALGRLGAQTCSISSTARGPLSCSVTTTVRMTVRIPSMVGVAMTPSDARTLAAGSTLHAGLSVKTNRSYAVQISRAPIDSADSIVFARSRVSRVSWTTPHAHAELADTPTEIDGLSEPNVGREAIPVAFALDTRPDVAPFDPIRLLLTVVAP